MALQRMSTIVLAASAVLAVCIADARASATRESGGTRVSICAVDTPSLSAREYWRTVRSDTSSDILTERTANGLSDVPINSIDYVTDDRKCGAALNALNAINQSGDSTTFRRTITLVSWGGVRYIAPLGGGGLEHWAVFDSTLAFQWVLTPLSQ